ncbi:MAG: hypothetical protein HRT53_13445 [Colwellia sp.]|nr:hypothetical protein [Colwellia sp.]
MSLPTSLWWHDQVILKDAENILVGTTQLNNYLYVNLSNETGDMLSAFEQDTKLLEAHTPREFSYNSDLDKHESHGTSALIGQTLAYRYLDASLQCPEEIIAQGIPAIKQFYKIQSE